MNGKHAHTQWMELPAKARAKIARASASEGRAANLPAALVAFDVLATGYTQEIFDIGAVRYEDGVEAAAFSAFVNPGRRMAAEELEDSGVGASMLAGAPGLLEVIPAFHSFLGDAVLAVHGDSYSMWLMRKAFERAGGALLNPTIDALPCSRRLFEILRMRYPYPDYLMNDFMAPRAEPYRAVESARLCGGEFLRAFELLGLSGW